MSALNGRYSSECVFQTLYSDVAFTFGYFNEKSARCSDSVRFNLEREIKHFQEFLFSCCVF